MSLRKHRLLLLVPCTKRQMSEVKNGAISLLWHPTMYRLKSVFNSFTRWIHFLHKLPRNHTTGRHRSKVIERTLNPPAAGRCNLLSGATATTITAGCVNWSAAASINIPHLIARQMPRDKTNKDDEGRREVQGGQL